MQFEEVLMFILLQLNYVTCIYLNNLFFFYLVLHGKIPSWLTSNLTEGCRDGQGQYSQKKLRQWQRNPRKVICLEVRQQRKWTVFVLLRILEKNRMMKL